MVKKTQLKTFTQRMENLDYEIEVFYEYMRLIYPNGNFTVIALNIMPGFKPSAPHLVKAYLTYEITVEREEIIVDNRILKHEWLTCQGRGYWSPMDKPLYPLDRT